MHCRPAADYLFEVFFELAKPVAEDEAPYILQQFPIDFNDQVGVQFIKNGFTGLFLSTDLQEVKF
jgi:hypothetical protein